MKRAHYQSPCARAENERSLLSPAAAARWTGFPVAWIEDSPHQVESGIDVETSALLLIDAGSVRADIGYGLKSLSWDLTAGSLGLFTEGTHIHRSRWRWAAARRARVELDFARLDDPGLLEQGGAALRGAELEFRDEALAAVVRCVLREVADGCPNGPLYADSLSLGIALRLQQRGQRRDPRRRERGKLTAEHIHRLEELIRSSLGRQLSLRALAAATGFSSAQFVRLFKNTLGCTPFQYVLRARLDLARDLVEGTEIPLALIAEDAGFASQSHMTAAFVRAFRAPPGEMRRQANRGLEPARLSA